MGITTHYVVKFTHCTLVMYTFSNSFSFIRICTTWTYILGWKGHEPMDMEPRTRSYLQLYLSVFKLRNHFNTQYKDPTYQLYPLRQPLNNTQVIQNGTEILMYIYIFGFSSYNYQIQYL